MKTNKTSKVFKTISIINLAIGAVILLILASQIALGSLSTLDASQITYNSENMAEVARAHNFEILHALTVFISAAAMFTAGLLGIKANNSKKIGLCAIFAAFSVVCWIGAGVFHDTAYSSFMRTYDIYPDTSVPTLTPIILILIVHFISALKNKKRLTETAVD